MRNSQKDSPLGSTKLGRRCTLTEYILDIFSSRPRQTVTYPVAIALAKKSARIWTLDSSGRLLTRLVDTELEALAYIFLVNRSYIRMSLRLSVISKDEIRITLSSLPRTGQKSMSASMTLYVQGLRRCTGRGDEKQDLQSPPY